MAAIAGRNSLYDNEDTRLLLQKLVFEARKDIENGKTSGVLRISDMVRYSALKNKENPTEYPVAYNKDAWSVYGKAYIERANVLPSKKVKLDNITFEMPNFSELVSKYKGDEKNLLKYLLPLEKVFNRIIEELVETRETIEELSEQNRSLVQTIKKYERMTLAMSHEGTMKIYREKYGIKNILSIEENPEAIEELDKLDQYFSRTLKDSDSQRGEILSKSNNNVEQKIRSLMGRKHK